MTASKYVNTDERERVNNDFDVSFIIDVITFHGLYEQHFFAEESIVFSLNGKNIYT